MKGQLSGKGVVTIVCLYVLVVLGLGVLLIVERHRSSKEIASRDESVVMLIDTLEENNEIIEEKDKEIDRLKIQLRRTEMDRDGYKSQLELVSELSEPLSKVLVTVDTKTWGVYHHVQPGDTLWDIAGMYYQDHFRWPEIYEYNRFRISDPDLIYPGQKFLIPNM